MGLSLRAKVPVVGTNDSQWKTCQPDVSSIRNSSRQDYLEPVVHEIKVNSADLLGDLKRPKRTVSDLPFAVWKATPRRGSDLDSAQVALTCG